MARALGSILIIMGVIFLTPLAGFVFYPSERSSAAPFLVSGLSLMLVGTLLVLASGKRGKAPLSELNGSVVVLLSWLLACLVSTIPLMRLGSLGFTQALFESVSGWTTTGLSVVDVTSASHTILLWRSIMQLAGGAGLAIIMLAAFSMPIGAGLYRAEGRTDQLVPHVVRSAKLVMMLYLGYAVAGIIAYRIAGMSLFDAINHSFAAVSTGGFSTRAESIGYWDSPLIEAITIPLMILGNTNFLTAYLLFSRKFRAFFRNGELRLFALLFVVGSITVFFAVSIGLYPTLGKGIRVAIFESVTALTTTGFSTVGYGSWNPTGILILIILMLIGGGTCSTAGGIKQYRVYLLGKSIWWEIKRSLSPRNAIIARRIHQGEDYSFVSVDHIMRTGTFVFLYIAVFLMGSCFIATFGYSMSDSLFEFASSLGTVGLSVGITGAGTPLPVLWVQIVGMLLGRLEFFVVFVAIGKMARDVKDLNH
ncbi:MAG TPA: TrkH family potassium uptake protein [bacterium]|nr:TrkH family potassium uptake protein [bacterium]